MSQKSDGAASFGSALHIARVEHLETPLSSEVREEKVQLWQWLSIPICGLLVMFSMPTMSFGLYKKAVQEVLALDSAEVQDILSLAFVGAYMFCPIPGLLYDACGYTVTILTGGFMATSGAVLWYWLLRDGGEPGSPTWYGLGFSLMVMCHGCRYLYVAGVCAILGIVPQRLSSTVSGLMAICVSLGYVLLPLTWSWAFLPSKMTKPEAFNRVSGHLANLKPVSSFFLLLSVIYACTTVGGLSLARRLKPKQSGSVGSTSLIQRLRRLRDPGAMALVVHKFFTHSFMSAYMTSGVAEAAHHAGAGPAEVAAALFWMGICGLVGRFFTGLSSDFLSSYTPARQAGREVTFIIAISCSFMGYCLMIYSKDSWIIATYLIAFGHGGVSALTPAAVGAVFPKAERGFWMSSLICLLGMLSWVYGRLGAALGWNLALYAFGAVGALLTIFMFLVVACINWGQHEPSNVPQVSVRDEAAFRGAESAKSNC